MGRLPVAATVQKAPGARKMLHLIEATDWF
jgi:hypothetical protein